MSWLTDKNVCLAISQIIAVVTNPPPRPSPCRKVKYFIFHASYVNQEVFRSLEVSSCYNYVYVLVISNAVLGPNRQVMPISLVCLVFRMLFIFPLLFKFYALNILFLLTYSRNHQQRHVH